MVSRRSRRTGDSCFVWVYPGGFRGLHCDRLGFATDMGCVEVEVDHGDVRLAGGSFCHHQGIMKM